MSRTFKDTPRRVRGYRDPHRREDHGPTCEDANYNYRWSRIEGDKPCDIHLSPQHDSGRPRTVEKRTYTRTIHVYNPDWMGDGWDHLSKPMIIDREETRTYLASVRHTPGCEYAPSDEYHHYYSRPPRRDDRHELWYGPSRTEERTRLSEVAKDYRANGATDHVELDHGYHRHGIEWYW